MSRCMRAIGFHVPPDSLPDGVYWVSGWYGAKQIDGGFEIRRGCIVRCAPCIQDRLYYWFDKAVKLSD